MFRTISGLVLGLFVIFSISKVKAESNLSKDQEAYNDSDTVKTINLKDKKIPLLKIKVKASRNADSTGLLGNKGLQYYTPQAIELTNKQLEQDSNSNDVYKALEKKSYINIGRSVGLRNAIDLRGQGGKSLLRVQLLYNGIPLNSLDNTHDGNYRLDNLFPTTALQKVVVIPGGGSVIYGNGTQGGVVSFDTNFTLFSPNPVLSVELGIASFETNNAALSAGNYFFNNRLFLQTDIAIKDTKAFYRGEHSESGFSDIFAKFFITDEQSLGYSYTAFQRSGVQGIMVRKLPDPNKGDWRAPPSSLQDAAVDAVFHQLLYQADFNRVKIENNTFYTKKRWFTLPTMGLPNTMDNTAMGNKVKVNINYGKTSKSNVMVGLDLIHQKHMKPTPGGKGLPFKYYKDTASAFVIGNNFITSKLYTVLGYRFNYDHWRRNTPIGANSKVYGYILSNVYSTYNEDSINASLGYEYLPNGKVWVSYVKGFNAPDASQFRDQIKNIYYLNNLKYEHYYTYEVGVTQAISATNTSFKASVFFTKDHNELYVKSLPLHDYSYNNFHFNVGRVNRLGLESNIKQQISSNLNMEFGLSLLKAKLVSPDLDQFYQLKEHYKDDSRFVEAMDILINLFKNGRNTSLAKLPAVTLTTNLEWNIVKPFFFNAGVKYISAYYADILEPKYKVPGVAVVDISARLVKNKFTFTVAANNLTDEHYVMFNSHTSGIPAPGRNYSFSVRYDFL